MRRMMCAVMAMFGLLVASPVLASTAQFNFSYEAFPDEFFTGSGQLTLTPGDGGTFAITGISGSVANIYEGQEQNRWAITGLNEGFATNIFDQGYNFVGTQFLAGLAFSLDGGPLVAIIRSPNGLSFFVGETRGPGSFSVTPNVSAVPEPASWAMMIAGFGIIGAGLRVRRRPASSRAAVAV